MHSRFICDSSGIKSTDWHKLRDIDNCAPLSRLYVLNRHVQASYRDAILDLGVTIADIT